MSRFALAAPQQRFETGPSCTVLLPAATGYAVAFVKTNGAAACSEPPPHTSAHAPT